LENAVKIKIAFYLLWCVMMVAVPSQAQPLESVVVSVPGPRNISYLPIDLIPAIGADKEEGLTMQLLHTGGGGVALSNLTARNADYAVAGVPAAMSLRAHGGDVVVIAAVDDAPLFVLMVRSVLKGKVKRIGDLRGKVIGVNTSTKSSKTTSQQLVELLLKTNGVAIDSVRIVHAGQSWEGQSSTLFTGTADAVMGDEPFATRLLKENQVFFLANLAEPATVRNVPGANFLHAALETRSDIIQSSPLQVEKVVKALRKTLQWIAVHKPEQIVDTLGVSDPVERESLLSALKKYTQAFSADGRFSTQQLSETDRFFQSGSKDNTNALRIENMVNDKWAGRRK
jgi:NitT/TauT family transport system substrate-binding protein